MTSQEINEAVAQKLGVDPRHGCSCFIRPTCGHTLRNYCTDIAAAWKITEKFDFFELIKLDSGGWEVWTGDESTFVADTAPMAICLAFLKLP